ncbi:hypothetical protein [Labedaea rhizosphaerae]|uniref:Uncharacterized protein n=1 Tax=Labedaea rhizosphaerae TaxID=598644 RepID=A0A4R6S5X0_LABRH|nr:hypothetical protein [Labedaea rhizosphaerae]TDP95061.1 hypothetical protein EV186_105293 [Labedaea rhizosphaerae]
MTLPPGRGPIPVPGINADTDPELAKAAGELNAWVDYLSNPQTNNGPRIYRPTVEKNISGQTLIDVPVFSPDNREGDPDYRAVSALDGFATMPDQFFIFAKAIAGINEATISQGYDMLTKGCFTFPPPADHVDTQPPPNATAEKPVRDGDLYDELGQIRIDWLSMRYGWTATEHLDAQLFEDDLIRFQVYVENGFLRIAETLVKYRMIYKKASEAMAKQMDGLTKRFADYGKDDGAPINWTSIIITGIVELVCAVLTDGVSAVVQASTLAAAGAQMVGEGAKGATSAEKPKEEENPIGKHAFLKDTVIDYMKNMTKLEQDTAKAINDLGMNLHTRVSQLEQARRYTNKSTNASSDMAPQFMDYAKNWRV